MTSEMLGQSWLSGRWILILPVTSGCNQGTFSRDGVTCYKLVKGRVDQSVEISSRTSTAYIWGVSQVVGPGRLQLVGFRVGERSTPLMGMVYLSMWMVGIALLGSQPTTKSENLVRPNSSLMDELGRAGYSPVWLAFSHLKAPPPWPTPPTIDQPWKAM